MPPPGPQRLPLKQKSCTFSARCEPEIPQVQRGTGSLMPSLGRIHISCPALVIFKLAN